MTLTQRVSTALSMAVAFTACAWAQAPPPATGQGRTSAARPPTRIAPTQVPAYRRSIVHHNPYPYPSYYHGDETAGFRNPGGTGRFREYYPPNDQFQLNTTERDPVQVAKFDQGGGAPDRAEQLQAESLGIAKYNSIQGHIDSYARPMMGYGFGVGGFGGVY